MFGSTDCSFLWWPIKLSAVLLVCNNAQFRITFLVFTLVNCSVWIIRLLFSSNYKTACCHDWEEGDCPKITATQDCKSLSRSLGEFARRRLRAAQKYQVLNCKSKLHVVLDLGSETEMDKSKFAVFDLVRQRWAGDGQEHKSTSGALLQLARLQFSFKGAWWPSVTVWSRLQMGLTSVPAATVHLNDVVQRSNRLDGRLINTFIRQWLL